MKKEKYLDGKSDLKVEKGVREGVRRGKAVILS
jgi:hypothetical protein